MKGKVGKIGGKERIRQDRTDRTHDTRQEGKVG
jgi:hypothetical protein